LDICKILKTWGVVKGRNRTQRIRATATAKSRERFRNHATTNCSNHQCTGNDPDPDGDQLTITAVGTATQGQVINNGNGTVTYLPNGNLKGIDTFVYTICAPEGCLTASSTAAVTVQVRAGKK
jgi:Bacterial Ig domain